MSPCGIVALCLSLSPIAGQAATAANRVISLDGDDWRLAIDPKDTGIAESWWARPRPDAKKAKVPWIIQGDFPGYAGYAWYWLDLVAPIHPHQGGRYLLRFWDVDYLCDVWVNGARLGSHEGSQARFELDATSAIQPGARNLIAVRVLSIFGTIGGISRSQTPHGGYRDFNLGGILDSVELLLTPALRTEDLFVRADPTSGEVRAEAAVRNDSGAALRARLEFSIAPPVAASAPEEGEAALAKTANHGRLRG